MDQRFDEMIVIGSQLPRDAPARAIVCPSKNLATWMVVASEHAHHDDRGPDEGRPAWHASEQVGFEVAVSQQKCQLEGTGRGANQESDEHTQVQK